MKKLWIVSFDGYDCIGFAESRKDAIRWLVRSGWLKLNDEEAIFWHDKQGQYHESSVRKSARKFEMSIEEFLTKVFGHEIDNYGISFFTLSEEEMIEHDDRPLE